MEESFSSSCEWASDLRRGPTAAFVPRANITQRDTFAQDYNQFCMNTASAFTMNSIHEPTTDNCAYSQDHYSSPSENLELLNIPSIHETMGSSFGFQDISVKQTLAGEWNYSGERNECSDDVLCSRNKQSAHESFEEEEEEEEDEEEEEEDVTSRNVPREPIKRLRRQRANDRERRRMKSLNGALHNLKRCIPLPKTKRRVTKLEILRIACHYIQTLWDTLNTGNDEQTKCVLGRNANRHHVVNGISVTQRLSLLSNNLKFNFQL